MVSDAEPGVSSPCNRRKGAPVGSPYRLAKKCRQPGRLAAKNGAWLRVVLLPKRGSGTDAGTEQRPGLLLSQGRSPLSSLLSANLLVALAYAALGAACLLLRNVEAHVAAFWLPSGLVAALALRRGVAVMPGVVLGGAALNALFSAGPLWSHGAVGLSHGLAGWVVALLAPRWMPGPDPFASLRHLLGFLLPAVLGEALHTLVGGMLAAGARPGLATPLPQLALSWFAGGLVGLLALAPLLLAWWPAPRNLRPQARLRLLQRLERPLLGLALVLVVVGARAWPLTPLGQVPLALLLPLLLLAATRFQPPALTVLQLLVVLASPFLPHELDGPPVAWSDWLELEVEQLRALILLISPLILLVVNRERRRLIDQLEDTVAQRTADLRRSQAQAEAALASLQQLEASSLRLAENVPVGTYVLSLDAELHPRFRFISDRALAICGLTREQFQRQPDLTYTRIHPEDRARLDAANRASLQDPQPLRWRGRMLLEGGQQRWVAIDSNPRLLGDGTLLWEGVIRDISEQVEAQEALAASERRLQRILDTLPIPLGFARLDGSGEIVYLNEHFCRQYGYGLERIPTMAHWAELAYPDPAYRAEVFREWDADVAAAMAAGASGVVTPREYRISCADGSTRCVLISAVVLDELLLGAFLDVSGQRRVERELERKLRTSLTAAATAHEINQPLSTLLLTCRLAEQELAGLGEGLTRERLTPLLNNLSGEAERVVRTIERMRMLLRNVQTGHERLDLVAVVHTVLLYQEPRFRAAGVRLECSGLDHPCWIWGDGAQLQTALSNLLTNAFESITSQRLQVAAGAGSGPAAAGRVRLELRQEPGDPAGEAGVVELAVHDDGPGFGGDPMATMPLASTKPDGLGMGLYLVHTTAENHRGSLLLERSAALGGALVRLRLPAAGKACSL